MRVRRASAIVVRRAPGNRRQALVAFGPVVRRAAIGRGGPRALKREGDGGTPVGRFVLREALYRADRMKRPRTGLKLRAIRRGDAWDDDPGSRTYNRRITLAPGKSGTEGLKRADHLYDLIVVLGHNDRPRVKGKGSAIFMHLARPGYTPTEGCIALSRRDLTMLLRAARPESRIVVLP